MCQHHPVRDRVVHVAGRENAMTDLKLMLAWGAFYVTLLLAAAIVVFH